MSERIGVESKIAKRDKSGKRGRKRDKRVMIKRESSEGAKRRKREK